MLLHVEHLTHYDYRPAASEARHLLRLRPREDAQQLLQHELQIEPRPPSIDHWQDSFGNATHFFSLTAPHGSLSVRSRSVVQTRPAKTPVSTTTWETVRERLRYARQHPPVAASEFVAPSELITPHADFLDYARPSFAPGCTLVDAAMDLMHRVHADFRYAPDATQVNTPVIDALRMRQGVCQDFAHVMVACLRASGLAARYVSGYMLTEPPAGQPRLIGADASHAWCAVWVAQSPHDTDGFWLELDPTNDRMPGEDYVRLAIGRDYADAAPMRGVIHGAASHTLRVEVTVMPLAAQSARTQGTAPAND